MSLRLIQQVETERRSIVDIGGGASFLVDRLIEDGYHDVTVVDIAAAALAHGMARLDQQATWIVADATTWKPGRTFALWHDRAVFHFLTSSKDRAAYVATASRSVEAGGHIVLGTFALDGPTMCSGLTVHQYDAGGLTAEFAPGFRLVTQTTDEHLTPSGGIQRFTFVVLQRL